MLPAKLLFIADPDKKATAFPSILRAALEGGCRWVMLRGVNANPKLLLSAALYAKNLCRDYDAKLFISRDVDLARHIKADGLHVQAGLPAHRMRLGKMMLGQSCHSEREIGFAEQSGVDYITLSPVFPTPSKPGYGPALGLSKLQALAKKTSLPVCALGGITPQNAGDCLRAGAVAVAVMGGIGVAAQPQARTKAYLEALKDLSCMAESR